MIIPDFRHPEDAPDSQLTNVPYANTASKNAEEEKTQNPKKVSILSQSLLIQIPNISPDLLTESADQDAERVDATVSFI